MKIHTERDEMTVSGVEILNADNAAEFEQKITGESDGIRRIVLDADALTYISSAGLRALLRLKNQYDLSVVNVSSGVYDIFETTGFSTLMSVKHKRKPIRVDCCEIIGRGSRGTVYKTDADMAAKVFNEGIPLSSVESERELTRNSLIAGVPAMIPFEIADCDGRLAIVYELLSGRDYTEAIKEDPERKEAIIREYAEFVRKLNGIILPTDKFRSQKAAYLAILRACKERLSREDCDLYFEMLSAIPDRHNFVHGDCHMKNIMTGTEGSMIIDLEGCGYGHFFLELLAICCDYKLPGLPMFEGMKEFVVEMVMGFGKSQCLDIWNLFFEEYMGDGKNLQDIDEMCTVYAYLRHTLNAMQNPMLAPDFIIDKMKEYIRQKIGGELRGYKSLLTQLG